MISSHEAPDLVGPGVGEAESGGGDGAAAAFKVPGLHSAPAGKGGRHLHSRIPKALSSVWRPIAMFLPTMVALHAVLPHVAAVAVTVDVNVVAAESAAADVARVSPIDLAGREAAAADAHEFGVAAVGEGAAVDGVDEEAAAVRETSLRSMEVASWEGEYGEGEYDWAGRAAFLAVEAHDV